MIDPSNPPDIANSPAREIDEFLMFSVAVGGKNAMRTAIGISLFISLLPDYKTLLPFDALRRWRVNECYHLPCSATGWDGGHSQHSQQAMLASLLKQAGLGCYSQRARSFLEIIDSGIDKQVDSCTVEDLEAIYGIGKKTSRFFITYTRPWTTRYAILDVHILGWLREQGYDVPSSTPSGKRYDQIERIFIDEARARGVTPRQLDQAIWIARSRKIK